MLYRRHFAQKGFSGSFAQCPLSGLSAHQNGDLCPLTQCFAIGGIPAYARHLPYPWSPCWSSHETWGRPYHCCRAGVRPLGLNGLLNHLVRQHEEVWGYRDAEGLGGFEVDDQLGSRPCWLRILFRDFPHSV
jgi:hypothetical protein